MPKQDKRDRRKAVHLRADLYIVQRGKVHLITTSNRDLPVCFTPNGHVSPLPSEVTCKRCLRLLALHEETLAGIQHQEHLLRQTNA